jgi:hypothetical protein
MADSKPHLEKSLQYWANLQDRKSGSELILSGHSLQISDVVATAL